MNGYFKKLWHVPHVLLVGLSLPGVDWDATCGHGGCRMVLKRRISSDSLDIEIRDDGNRKIESSDPQLKFCA